jgi:hypothetical protein
MKSSMMKVMIAAAALAVVAGSASAQTYKAEIPLTFKAGNAVMAPGAYRVDVSSDGVLLRLRNTDTHSAVVVLIQPGGDVSKAWRTSGKPVFAFSCAESSCSLTRMWNGRDSSDYRFSATGNTRGEKVAELLVTLEKAE